MCDLVNLDYLEAHFSKLKGLRNVLEVGSYNINGNCKRFILSKGLRYTGIDIRTGPDVDLICDITDAIENIHEKLHSMHFDLVICMNVLEHLYEPIKALDNMKQLLRKDGYLIIVTPLVWDLHDWPSDFYRLNPDFFKKYMNDNNFRILEGTFLFSTRDSRQFYPDIKTLPMIIPHVYKKTLSKEIFSGITDENEALWAELVAKRLIDNNGTVLEKSMTVQSPVELNLSAKYAMRMKDIFIILQRARIGALLAYISQFAPELRESWPHLYINLIGQKH